MSYIHLPNITDERGELTFVESSKHIPFEIKRVFYLYGVPFGAERGGHAHKKCQQFIIPIAGKFYVSLRTLLDGARYVMEDPKIGLYVQPLMWTELSYFEPGSVCLVLASEPYDESDYIRNFGEFMKYVAGEI